MSSNELFVSSRKAAQLLGVSLRTVQLWVENGTLNAWKTAGGHRRVSKASVEKLLQEQRAALGKTGRGQELTVLVVEDDPVQLQTYEMQFGDCGFPVKLIKAVNGYEGLIEIGLNEPDLIISDLDMPTIDGFEMLRTIKNKKALDNIHIIVVTGLDDKEIREKGGVPAGIPVLKKPVAFDKLKTILAEKYGPVSQ